MAKGKKQRPTTKVRTPPKSARIATHTKPTKETITKKANTKTAKNIQIQQKLLFRQAIEELEDDDMMPPLITPEGPTQTDNQTVLSTQSDITDTPLPPTKQADRASEIAGHNRAATVVTDANAQPTIAALANPTALNQARPNRTTLRYKVTIQVEPCKQPIEEFSKNLRKVFRIMQAVAGTDLWIAPWDEEQESAFKILKKPSDIPDGSKYDDRFTLAIYTGSFLNLKTEGSTVWVQLRLVHKKELKVAISQLGNALQHSFQDLSFSVRFNRQPNHCQATKSACLGWLYGSTKTISEEQFLPAIRKTLNIPSTVAFGIQWRAITDKFGKRPPFDKENPPSSAIHLDMDYRYAATYQRAASNLWRQYDKQKNRPQLPNGIQLRLVPCFSSTQCRALSATAMTNITLMRDKQHFFVTERIVRLEVPFINLLDSPLSTTNEITLRQAIMSRAPRSEPTKRLIHNVDFGWQDAHRVFITTIQPYLSEAHDFISSLIPEMVFRHGQACQPWFTAEGLTFFESVTWNPETMATTSSADQDTQDLLDEDLWGLGNDWRIETKKLEAPIQAGTSILKNQVTTRNLEDDDDIQSFASTFGNKRIPKQKDDIPDKGHTKEGGKVTLSTEIIELLRRPRQNHTDTCSMSTAAKTTESTRVKLSVARNTIDEQKAEIAIQAAELEQLRIDMEHLKQSTAHLGKPTPHDDESMETESIIVINSNNSSPKQNLLSKFTGAKTKITTKNKSKKRQISFADLQSDEDPGSIAGASRSDESTNSSVHSPLVGHDAVDSSDDGVCDA